MKSVEKIIIFLIMCLCLIRGVKAADVYNSSKKGVIFYYSRSYGNTRRIAYALKELIEKEYETKVVEINQKIIENGYNCKDFDLIGIGSPVHFRRFNEKVRKFISKLEGIENKNIILFNTYGSGWGRITSLAEQENVILSKKAKNITSIAYPGPYSSIEKDKLLYALDKLIKKSALTTDRPHFIPLNDMYCGKKIHLSGNIRYLKEPYKFRVNILGVWSEEAFLKNEVADIAIFDDLFSKQVLTENTLDYKFDIALPEQIGNVYLGMIDYASRKLPQPQVILNDTEGCKINVVDNDIKEVELLVDKEKVFIQGQVKNPGAYEFFEGMTVADLIAICGGLKDAKDKLVLSIDRSSDIANIHKFKDKVLLTKQNSELKLEIADYIIIERR